MLLDDRCGISKLMLHLEINKHGTVIQGISRMVEVCPKSLEDNQLKENQTFSEHFKDHLNPINITCKLLKIIIITATRIETFSCLANQRRITLFFIYCMYIIQFSVFQEYTCML